VWFVATDFPAINVADICKVAPQSVNVDRKIKATFTVDFVVVVIILAYVSKKKYELKHCQFH